MEQSTTDAFWGKRKRCIGSRPNSFLFSLVGNLPEWSVVVIPRTSHEPDSAVVNCRASVNQAAETPAIKAEQLHIQGKNVVCCHPRGFNLSVGFSGN